MNVKVFVLILAILGVSDGFFKSKLQKLKGKAMKYYEQNVRKSKTWHFLGKDPALYPGVDVKYKLENQKKWDEHYKCLRAQQQALGSHGTPVPEAVQAFEGGHARFQCKLCLSPQEQDKIESVTWYYGKIFSKFLEIVVYDEHVMLSPDDKTLHLYNLKQLHSGQYVCILGDSVTVPYYLNVQNVTSALREVRSEYSPKGPHPMAMEFVPGQDLVVDTEWSDWSPCSKCKHVGKRHRLGYCVVRYRTAHRTHRTAFEKFKQAMLNESVKIDFNKPKEEKTVENEKIDEAQVQLVKIFSEGIPCKAHILPRSIKANPKVANRSDEVMIGYCKVKCKEVEVFEVKDRGGKVLETANNSAGIYSMVQGLPPVAPPVERNTQYERMGADIVITCPGNLNSDDPMVWQINSKIMVPDIIAEESNGRIYISLLDRIHIKKAKISDSNLYSCWQHNELAGTVRLIVEKKLKLSFNHHVMLLGMLLILSTFVYVFVKALFGRKHAKLARK